ncbi:cytochrome-c peroxidase [Crocinitomicaceae bacterium]|nr:cytochrome-c peroxidase [Crocinitomicaceae bacterium]
MSIKSSFLLGGTFLVFSFYWFTDFHRAPIYYIPKPHYKLPVNPKKNDTVQLGRMLFYDNILSANNEVSCASCHNSYNAFAHTDHELSHGIYDSTGNRNAPALFNLAWQKEFMWDGAVHHIEAQALAPLHDPRELGSSIDELLIKLKSSSFYRTQFFKVFGDSIINSKRILKSLSAFELSLVSFNSKYDRIKQGQEVFTEQEKQGYLLFQNHCSRCHTEPLFSNFEYLDNGLPIDPFLQDYGRFLITNVENDKFKFKVPSLRNLSYTFPYMHDGRFDKLRKVLAHYGDIDVHSRVTDVKSIPLSFNEQSDLISFLLTLNDESFVFNKEHAFPNRLKEELIKK